eukprot:1221118-Amphidinium_carterae.1
MLQGLPTAKTKRTSEIKFSESPCKHIPINCNTATRCLRHYKLQLVSTLNLKRKRSSMSKYPLPPVAIYPGLCLSAK